MKRYSITAVSLHDYPQEHALAARADDQKRWPPRLVGFLQRGLRGTRKCYIIPSYCRSLG